MLQNFRICFRNLLRPRQMLAQRWEKPSTAREERQTILRARRLCEERSEIKNCSNSEEASSDSPSQSSPSFKYFNDGKTFLTASWIFGVQQNLLIQIFETLPGSLMQAIIFLEDTLHLLQKPIRQMQFESSTSNMSQSSSHVTLMYRWDPDTLERTCVEASSEFCRSIAGMNATDFHRGVESSLFPLPCSPFQYLFYFLDGSLCMGEGQTSWTRSFNPHCISRLCSRTN